MFVDMLQLCQYEKMTGTLREDLHDNVYQKEMKTNDSTRIITLFLHFRTCVVYALVTRDCCAWITTLAELVIEFTFIHELYDTAVPSVLDYF